MPISLDSLTMHQLIRMTAELDASDLLVKAGQVPMLKRYNVVKALNPELPVLDEYTVKRMLSELMSERMLRIFDETMEMDLGFTVEGLCRVRCDVYMQRG